MRQVLPKAIDIVFQKELPEIDAHVVLMYGWLLQSPGEAPRCDLRWDHGVFKGAEGGWEAEVARYDGHRLAMLSACK